MNDHASAVRLVPVGGDESGPRFFIRCGSLHAGGITVHSVSGERFSYGIAIVPALRRKGMASAALGLLFSAMRARGFTRVVVQVAGENAASLALHDHLGFFETARAGGVVTLERAL